MMEYLGFYHYEQYSLIISSHVPLYFLSASTCLSPLPPSWLGWVALSSPSPLCWPAVCVAQETPCPSVTHFFVLQSTNTKMTVYPVSYRT